MSWPMSTQPPQQVLHRGVKASAIALRGAIKRTKCRDDKIRRQRLGKIQVARYGIIRGMRNEGRRQLRRIPPHCGNLPTLLRQAGSHSNPYLAAANHQY